MAKNGGMARRSMSSSVQEGSSFRTCEVDHLRKLILVNTVNNFFNKRKRAQRAVRAVSACVAA